ncbi:periplasmic heavy metal sensor [Teichococcus vastitatis]|jgi:uncharacterized membrane protein|uniref:Periplasmic heavy metal sensor n=1 Tax=Teichococcus vastitatis TaxID=2307076 RepID=A0ABS9W314_9PROT|nr:periplasmic heavy metal sensor [Pseudoroseomonas vastitatis]MCI0753682.1 periplasmic heavy metal sensor [Pseudoroseomonas vastitatis]
MMRPIWLKGLLGASLALNLVLGALLWWRSGPPPGPGRLQARIERVLPEADRDAFRRAMQGGRPRYEAAQAGLREGSAGVQAVLAQQPFDPARLRAAMAESRARWGEFGRLYEDSLVEALSAISPEGRQRVAQDMAQGDRHGSRNRRN